MKTSISKFAIVALLSIFGYTTAFADTKISALPAADPLVGNEPLPVVQPGGTVKTTPAAIATYVQSTGTLGVNHGGTGAVTLTGPLKGNGTSAIGAAAASDIIGLWGGSCGGLGTFLKANGNCSSVSLTTDVSGQLPVDQGGTGNQFFTVSGPASTAKTFTFPNASSTVLTTNAAVTVAQGGTGATTLTGPLKGNGTSAFTAATSTDIIGLWTGTCNSGTFLRADGSCQAPASGSPGGADTNIQYNNSSAFGGEADFTWNATTNTMTVGSNATAGIIKGADNSSGAGTLITLKGSASTNSGSAGGAVTVVGGTSSDGTGGGVAITGGAGVTVSAANRAGGAVSMSGGAAVGASTGGSVDLVGGAAGGTGNGGGITLTGGNPAAGNGGAISLIGRAGVGTNKSGGSVSLTPGAQSDSGGFYGTVNFAKWQSDSGYDYQTPATGFSYTVPDGTTTVIIDPAGTLATGTVTMAAKPNDGQLMHLSTTQIITGLTLSANSGQTIKNAPTTLAAGGKVSYIYRTSNTTWYVY